jgi:hypothetical protein
LTTSFNLNDGSPSNQLKYIQKLILTPRIMSSLSIWAFIVPQNDILAGTIPAALLIFKGIGKDWN